MAPARVVDQELVVHLFAPFAGPHAADAYAEFRRTWRQCRELLGMTVPLDRPNLARDLPETLDQLPRNPGGGEIIVAAQKHPDALHQAILRVFHGVLNLSVLLSPGVGADRSPDAPGWAELDRRWTAAAGSWSGHLLGAARLFLGKSADEEWLAAADSRLAEQAAPDLPSPQPTGWWHDGAATSGGIALWEPGMRGPDSRPERKFLILARPDRDDQLSDWTWSDGEPTMPPLGRYLLHATKARYQLRVRQETDDLHRVQQRLDSNTPEALREIRSDLAFWTASLRDLRQNVKVAAANMRRALGPDAPSSAGPGPLADDFRLIAWLQRDLKNDLVYLRTAADQARMLSELHAVPTALAPGESAPMPTARDVFVIHGRDEQARRALWGFLQAIDLHPLDWEEVVRRTGKPSPYMGEVLAQAFEHNQAAIVLLTPDDGASLHTSLRGPTEPSYETTVTGQARPNVLLEAGMALGLQRDRTVVIEIGQLRPVSDMAGLNVIRFDGTVESLHKIAQRLEGAGCAVNTKGTGWLDVSRFENLAAYTRTF